MRKAKHSTHHAPAYRLHIDMPHHTGAAHAAGQSAHRGAMRRHWHIISNRAWPPWLKKTWAFTKDKLEFIFVSLAVFVVIYIAMNWQAIWLNIEYYMRVRSGEKSLLQHLVEEKTPESEKLLPAMRAAAPSQILIPALNLEIHPPDMRIIIPRINQNLPIVGVKNENLIAREWDKLEKDIQQALRNGVIHYPGTALPGENGNVVITGHSSYYAWDKGRFKDVFALLHDVRLGDRIVVYFNQKKYVYEVDAKKVVLPKDVDVLAPSSREQLTLITCTPIGTNLKRLIVTARLVEKN